MTQLCHSQTAAASAAKGTTMNTTTETTANSGANGNDITSLPKEPQTIPPNSPLERARAHAERSFPSHQRPKCVAYAKLFDYYKQHCIDERLRIETERDLAQELELARSRQRLPQPG